jgi:hypothetical protein
MSVGLRVAAAIALASAIAAVFALPRHRGPVLPSQSEPAELVSTPPGELAKVG